MSENPRPALKSITATPDGPRSAEQTPAADQSGAPKAVAEGVPLSVRPDPRPADGRRPIAWLRIVAPPSFGAPTEATAWCECDKRVRTATGRTAVLQLVEAHNHHRTVCPLLATQEGKAA
ncbi:hypothetical protein [Streptomyces erythrochromogenes]|uniref:hypothetical protein n=1 Tax=Streptomyces erythrochromogenes TaxID=285574 RepID=UPI0004CD667C|nr:hypothetical protein [Streptomyces erythrochromogenes]